MPSTIIDSPVPECSRSIATSVSSASRVAGQASFRTSDGEKIFYRMWKPRSPSSKAVLLFHRGHEHSGRWQDFVDRSELDDCWIFAWDARGHGKSGGERGAAESFARLTLDVEEFSQHLCQQHAISLSETAVVGQSVGAVLAAAWVHDYAPPVRAMVLATPAFDIKLYVPFAIPALRLVNRLAPGRFIRSYVRPGMLTHDSQEADAYRDDPLVSPQIAVNVLLDLRDTSARLIDDAAAIDTPTLMLVSGKDYVVRQQPQREFYERLSSPDKRIEILKDFYHSTFWEKDRGPVIRQAVQFVRSRLQDEPAEPNSERLRAFSEGKYRELQKAAPPLARLGFGFQRTLLNTAGRLSRGIRIGWRDGFDSGQSLDHVYRNCSEGTTIIGRAIDGLYLNSVGWRGIRQRKVHLQAMLDAAILDLAEQQREITILDVAAGPGRYVLETIRRYPSLDIRAVLCDRDPGGIAEGRQLAEELGLKDRVRFSLGDAFDPDSIREAAGEKSIDIAIVSGLYELFPDNRPIERSLQGLADLLSSEGRLIYTNQPWHPQQEMIARVLPNRDGQPWVMRCRSQAEMDALVAEAGLQRERLSVDRWGIFSVGIARQKASR